MYSFIISYEPYNPLMKPRSHEQYNGNHLCIFAHPLDRPYQVIPFLIQGIRMCYDSINKKFIQV